MKVAFCTLGCKVNQYESQLMRESLTQNGYTLVSETENPDVFIVNSCTVTAESDRKTRQMIRKYRQKFPKAVLVLTGCMPQAFPDTAELLPEADIVLGNSNHSELCAALDEFQKNGARITKFRPHKQENFSDGISKFYEHTKSYLKIEDGCDRFCSYCIIPTARGRVRSKPIEDIREEAGRLAQNGYKEIVLIGINLSAYGRGTDLNLADAVSAAADTDGIERIRLGSMEPDQITPEMIGRLAAEPKLCDQFHLSLQSGCDKTLRAMNRHYDTAFYRDLIRDLRNKFPNAGITTDIMVGFPGETDADFEASLSFAKEIAFSSAHVFAYSRRKGTKADLMSGQISNEIKKERSRQMIEATKASEQAFLQAQKGLILPVLLESRGDDGYLEGYTKNYSLVKTKCADALCGKIINVKITESKETHLLGEIEPTDA